MSSYFIDDFAADHEAEMEIEAEMEAEMDEPDEGGLYWSAGKCAFCGDPCNPAEQTCHDCRR